METRTKLQKIEEALNARYAERADFARGLMLAAVSGQHIFVLGPPGAGKTEMVADMMSCVEGKLFNTLMMRTTSPDEVFGPLSVKELTENGRSIRNIKGMAPACNVVNLEEIWKGSSATTNGFLLMLSQRKFQQGGELIDVPLLFAVASSNELPQDSSLRAMYSRFQLRFLVDQVKSKQALKKILWGKRPEMVDDIKVTYEEFLEAKEEASKLKFSAAAKRAAMEIVEEIRGAGLKPDVRKMVALIGQRGSVVQAQAWLEGATEVGVEHLTPLAHCLWDHPDQIDIVTGIVRSKSVPVENEVENRVTELFEAYRILQAADYKESEWVEMLRKVRSIQNAAEAGKLSIESKSADRIEEMKIELATTIVRKKRG